MEFQETGELRAVYVSSSSKRQGIATQILSSLEGLASLRQFEALTNSDPDLSTLSLPLRWHVDCKFFQQNEKAFMKPQSVAAMSVIWTCCTLFAPPSFAEFDKNAWKDSGGLCATISVRDGEEVEYTSRTERENIEDAEYNFTNILSLEECSFSAAQLILVFESLRPMIPDLFKSAPFSGGYLIYNDKGNLKTCTVTKRKPMLDRVNPKLIEQIVQRIGKPIPKDIRDQLNNVEMQNLIRQNISINCSDVFS